MKKQIGNNTKIKRGPVTVTVTPEDDGGLGQDFTDTKYQFKTQAEADAFMYGVRVGNEHGCHAYIE